MKPATELETEAEVGRAVELCVRFNLELEESFEIKLEAEPEVNPGDGLETKLKRELDNVV